MQIVSANFGLFRVNADKTATFTPSKTVPLTEGQAFGWLVSLKTAKPKVSWREEFTQPSPPLDLTAPLPETGQPLWPEPKVSITEREVDVSQGMILNSWSVSERDAKGRYVIRLTIENADPLVFEFDME